MNQKIKRLPDSELEVMQIIWSCDPPVSRVEMEHRMQTIHPVAQTTLLTLLTRLAGKGFIRIEKQGRSSVYTPLITQRDYLAVQSKRFIDKLCLGNLSAFATALCESGLSQDELHELRKLLEEEKL